MPALKARRPQTKPLLAQTPDHAKLTPTLNTAASPPRHPKRTPAIARRQRGAMAVVACRRRPGPLRSRVPYAASLSPASTSPRRRPRRAGHAAEENKQLSRSHWDWTGRPGKRRKMNPALFRARIGRSGSFFGGSPGVFAARPAGFASRSSWPESSPPGQAPAFSGPRQTGRPAAPSEAAPPVWVSAREMNRLRVTVLSQTKRDVRCTVQA